METTKEMNLAVGVELTLLSAHVNGYMKHNSEKKRTEILVMPEGVDPEAKLSFEDLTAQLASCFGITDPSKIKNAVKALQEFTPGNVLDWKEVSFQIYQLFFYAQIEGDKKEFEYAFSLKINLGLTIGPLSVKTVNLAVWNTKRVKILEQMGMHDFDKLLPTT